VQEAHHKEQLLFYAIHVSGNMG